VARVCLPSVMGGRTRMHGGEHDREEESHGDAMHILTRPGWKIVSRRDLFHFAI